jgi:inner membrane protein
MASVFGHIAASTALAYAFFPEQTRPAVLGLAAFCAAAPDLDVLAFRFGIDYGSEWGHRGWTHSIVFAVALGLLLAALFFRQDRDFWKIALLCVLATASHPLLDMLTNGGRGVALWWPFSLERLFFPWHPIQVSPLSAGAFFSKWGLAVLWSEAKWIGLPGLVLVAVGWCLRRL